VGPPPPNPKPPIPNPQSPIPYILNILYTLKILFLKYN